MAELTNERLREICSRPPDSYGKAGDALAPSRIADDEEIDLAFDELRALRPQRDRLVEALREARRYVARDTDPHDSHCAFICNNGKGPCDCPVPAIDAVLEEARRIEAAKKGSHEETN